MPELGDDGVIHEIGDLDPDIIEALRKIRALPDHIREHLIDLIRNADPGGGQI